MKSKTKLLLMSVAMGLGILVGIVSLMSSPPSKPAPLSTFSAVKDSLSITAPPNWWQQIGFCMKAGKELHRLQEKTEWTEADSLLFQELDRQLNQLIHD